MSESSRPNPVVTASYVLAALALCFVMWRVLLAALFSGLLVYALVQLLAPKLGKKLHGHRAQIVSVGLLSILVVAALSTAIWGIVTFLQRDAGRLPVLLEKMADILEASRSQELGRAAGRERVCQSV